jgi:hypothetical protein
MSDSLLLNSAEVRARDILANVFPYGADFPLHIAGLIRDLAARLDITESALDRSLRSLELVEEGVRAFGGGPRAVTEIFANLVAYMGEVLIDRNGGSWYMLWRPDHRVWEPYVVTESGEFCDPFTHLHDQLRELDKGFSLLHALGRMTADAGL